MNEIYGLIIVILVIIIVLLCKRVKKLSLKNAKLESELIGLKEFVDKNF